jgi:hypothetical protein
MAILKPIYNPFGEIDEQAMTDQFEDFVGGVKKAQRLWQLWKRYKYQPLEKYINNAKAEGFTENQALALLEL